jgi:hypothetical protein
MWRSGRTPGGHPLDTGVGPPSQTGSSCREPTSIVIYTGGATRPLRANFSETDEQMGATSVRRGPRAPAFSRFVMIRPVQTTRPRSGEHCCFCNGQGPQGRPHRSGHRPDNERTPGPASRSQSVGVELNDARSRHPGTRRTLPRSLVRDGRRTVSGGSPSVGSVHRTTSHPSGGASRPAPRRVLDETLCEVLARHSTES